MSWGAVVSAGVGLAGQALSSSVAAGAAGDAAKAQAEAAQQAAQIQDRQYWTTRADNQPYSITGTLANQRLRGLLGLGGTPGGNQTYQEALAPLWKKYLETWGEVDPATDTGPAQAARRAIYAQAEEASKAGIDSNASDYGSLLKKFSLADLNADPVYNSGLQFGLQQGTDAINARAIAGGGYDSGATLKALTRFGNDYGSTKANDSYNRFTNDQNNIYAKLSGTSATGQAANAANQAAGQANAASQGEYATQAGNARAAGIVGGANAWGGFGNAVSQAANNYQSNSILSKLLRGQTTGVQNAPNYWDNGYSYGIDQSGLY